MYCLSLQLLLFFILSQSLLFLLSCPFSYYPISIVPYDFLSYSSVFINLFSVSLLLHHPPPPLHPPSPLTPQPPPPLSLLSLLSLPLLLLLRHLLLLLLFLSSYSSSFSPLLSVVLPATMDDPRQRRPDITTAKQQLDWEPRVPVRDGLAKAIEYFSKVTDWPTDHLATPSTTAACVRVYSM